MSFTKDANIYGPPQVHTKFQLSSTHLGQRVLEEARKSSTTVVDDILSHVLKHGTPSSIFGIEWCAEESTWRHEYLLVKVSCPSENKISYIRVDRMKTLERDSVFYFKSDNIHKTRLAEYRSQLMVEEDRVVCEVAWSRMDSAPPLGRLAQLLHLFAEEVGKYSLLSFNCWWLSRQALEFMSRVYDKDLIIYTVEDGEYESISTEELSEFCLMNQWDQAAATVSGVGCRTVWIPIIVLATLPYSVPAMFVQAGRFEKAKDAVLKKFIKLVGES